MKKLVSINPATEEVNGEFELHSQDRINESIRKAKAASSAWRGLDVSDRAVRLRDAARALLARKRELGEIITLEMGKPIRESVPEIEKCAWALEYFAENAGGFLEARMVETDARKACICFEPRGIVLGIMPWNYPFWQAVRFAAPALAGGNVVLLKPSARVPICALELEEIFSEAGLPGGVLQTLLVDAQAASMLIGREEISAVSFTGSLSAGEKVAELAGRNMKKAVLELGGSDPFIVLPDADVEAAARAGVASRFQNAGQSCIAAKRFIIAQSVSEEFISLFAKLAAGLRIGDPRDEDTDLGPLAGEQQIEILEAQVQDALERGARAVLQGGRLQRKGFFYSPVILTGLKGDMRVLREETFGPLAPLMEVKDENEAIAAANDSHFGLGASIWSRDEELAQRLAREIQAGVVAINSSVRSDPRLPFGGVKKSGIGRELSVFGVHEFQNIKSISRY